LRRLGGIQLASNEFVSTPRHTARTPHHGSTVCSTQTETETLETAVDTSYDQPPSYPQTTGLYPIARDYHDETNLITVHPEPVPTPVFKTVTGPSNVKAPLSARPAKTTQKRNDYVSLEF
jgi:hypothetical protein